MLSKSRRDDSGSDVLGDETLGQRGASPLPLGSAVSSPSAASGVRGAQRFFFISRSPCGLFCFDKALIHLQMSLQSGSKRGYANASGGPQKLHEQGGGYQV